MGTPGVQFFDAASVGAGLRGFSGVVAAGGSLYFAPLNNGQFHGQVLRHDLSRPFGEAPSWSAFDCSRIDVQARGFTDVLSVGKSIYLVPFFNGRHHGRIVRHDPAADFHDPASWQSLDLETLQPGARGFVSGCCDGRYLYLSPYQSDLSETSGIIARHDTAMAFDDPAAWDFFDATRLHPGCRGFHSAVADGSGGVVFVPYLRQGKDYSGRILAHRAGKSFSDRESWTSFDLTSLDSRFRGYVGGCCHGGKLYLAPYFDGADRHGRVLRHDLGRPLDDPAAWEMFDCATLDPGSRGFFGAVADDAYLYLVPHCRGIGQYHGQVTRYSLGENFTAPSSWSFHELAVEDPRARGFIGGAVQDGSLYLAPFETDAGHHSGLIARIDTRAANFWRTT